LPYEEYALADVNMTLRYFMDGGQVYGYVVEGEGIKVTYVITAQSKDIPSGMFDIPSDYQTLSY